MIADAALQDMIDWFTQQEGQVGILDASNTQPHRRRIIYDRLQEHSIRPVFLECLYNHSHSEDAAVSEHIRELRLVCPEYTHVESEVARRDYKRRLDYYRPFYVTMGQEAEERERLQFVRLLDGGERIETNRVSGYLPSRMLYYLMNLHRGSKRIFLYRLPTNGTPCNLREYALPAEHFLAAIHGSASDDDGDDEKREFSVWTETSLLSAEVGEIFHGHELLTKPQLRGRDHGIVEGLSASKIHEQYPEEYAACQCDPYKYRYPRAESYHDLAVRLENVMMELEKSPRDVLILAEASVLRCIYAYFSEIPNRDIPQVEIPYNVLIELGPKAYGVFERRVRLDGSEEGKRDCEQEWERTHTPVFKPFVDDAQALNGK